MKRSPLLLNWTIEPNAKTTKLIINPEVTICYDSFYLVNVGRIIKLVNNLEDYEFNTIKTAEITGLTKRQVKFYTDMKVIIPEIDKGNGKGKVRKYSRQNLIEFGLIKQMILFGMNIKKIRKFIEDFRHANSEITAA